MKKTRFSEAQIVAILKSGDAGPKVKDIYREYGISGATYYNWKSKYGGMEISDLRRMKDPEPGLPSTCIEISGGASLPADGMFHLRSYPSESCFAPYGSTHRYADIRRAKKPSYDKRLIANYTCSIFIINEITSVILSKTLLLLVATGASRPRFALHGSSRANIQYDAPAPSCSATYWR